MARKYFSVTAKCGHVGRRQFIPIEFGISADTAKAAAKICRLLPRVKHDQKDAILAVREIDSREYASIRRRNDYDPYLHCGSTQEQNLVWEDIENRIVPEQQFKHETDTDEQHIKKTFFIGKQRIRNPRRYLRLQQMPDNKVSTVISSVEIRALICF